MRIRPFEHIGLKLLSVALALLFWMVVAGEEAVERGLRVPLELQQIPPGVELLGDVPATVDVRVRGSSGTLSRVAAGDIVAVLDLRGAQPGERLFHMTPDQVRTPFGVQVVQVTPATVALAFDTMASRLVRVAPAVEGKPAPGFAIGKIASDPELVEVAGPASAVERVREALTEPVSVAGARSRVQATVVIGTRDPTLRLKTPSSAIVTVEIVRAKS